MQQKFFLASLVASFLAFSPVTHAQYTPSQPGSLGVGEMTESSIEWKFNLGGALVNEVQLFVGDEKAARVTLRVPNYALSIIETGLSPNTRYEGRKVRAVYFGTAGPFSDAFHAVYTLQKVPGLRFEPFPPHNAFIYADGAVNVGTGMSAWQLYDVTHKKIWNWITTDTFQSGPFEAGKTYVFQVRARNADGVLTAWSQQISYTVPVEAGKSSSSSSGSPEAPGGPSGKIVVNVAMLNVRTQPSLAGKLIGIVRQGQSFSVLELKNGWYRIQFVLGKEGWVSGKYATTK